MRLLWKLTTETTLVNRHMQTDILQLGGKNRGGIAGRHAERKTHRWCAGKRILRSCSLSEESKAAFGILLVYLREFGMFFRSEREEYSIASSSLI